MYKAVQLSQNLFICVLDSTDVKLFPKDCFHYKRHTWSWSIFCPAVSSKQTWHAHLICAASEHCLSLV